ncbi:unnamed protein product [Gemmataceae bacterium]|nr:unnamed protein product [Gemmataceae bacterium]VTT98923.1 unnamed protein product [Gemmataceae bacterium]
MPRKSTAKERYDAAARALWADDDFADECPVPAAVPRPVEPVPDVVLPEPTHSHCAACGVAICLGQRMTPTARGWCHSLCCCGENGPLPSGETVLCARGYYVSVIDGSRRGLLLGPFDCPEAARASVDRGRAMAERADPRAVFYGYGVASSDHPHPSKFGV